MYLHEPSSKSTLFVFTSQDKILGNIQIIENRLVAQQCFPITTSTPSVPTCTPRLCTDKQMHLAILDKHMASLTHSERPEGPAASEHDQSRL